MPHRNLDFYWCFMVVVLCVCATRRQKEFPLLAKLIRPFYRTVETDCKTVDWLLWFVLLFWWCSCFWCLCLLYLCLVGKRLLKTVSAFIGYHRLLYKFSNIINSLLCVSFECTTKAYSEVFHCMCVSLFLLLCAFVTSKMTKNRSVTCFIHIWFLWLITKPINTWVSFTDSIYLLYFIIGLVKFRH